MTIVEIIPNLNWRAGAEVFCTALSTELSLKGNTVYLIVLNNGINHSYISSLNKSGVRLIFMSKKSKFDFGCYRRLKKTIIDINPDIVHTHLNSIVTYLLSFFFKKAKWKVFHTIHNIAKKESSGISLLIRKIAVKKGLVEMVGISTIISKTIKATYGVNSPTIYNGISIKNGTNKTNVQYDLICPARFTEQKNHLLLIEAMKILVKEKGYNIKLLCLGDGELLTKCKNTAIEHNLSDNIIFGGAVDDVSKYLMESKVFVLSSLYEGNPISIIEAMNFGLPIVAPDVGGIPDIVVDRENGYLYKVNDLCGLADCITNLLNDAKELSTISVRNKTKAKEFSISRCADDYVHLFAERSQK